MFTKYRGVSPQDVASGRSGHAEVVLVEYDPSIVTYEELLAVFWKSHDPTQVRGDSEILDSFTGIPCFNNSGRPL